MRICFVSPEYALHPPFGGIATYTRDAARWLAARGHDVHVVLVSRAGPLGTEDDAGVLVHSVPSQRIRPRRLLSFAGRLPALSLLREAHAGCLSQTGQHALAFRSCQHAHWPTAERCQIRNLRGTQ